MPYVHFGWISSYSFANRAKDGTAPSTGVFIVRVLLHTNRQMAVDTSRKILAGSRILLLEDNAFLGIVFEDMLREAGCCVLGPCRNLEDAWTAARAEKLDAAIMDVRIRDDTSFEFADALLREGVPIILVSGYNADFVPEKFREHFIQKPFDQAALLEMLCRCMAAAQISANTTGKPDMPAIRRREHAA